MEAIYRTCKQFLFNYENNDIYSPNIVHTESIRFLTQILLKQLLKKQKLKTMLQNG